MRKLTLNKCRFGLARGLQMKDREAHTLSWLTVLKVGALYIKEHDPDLTECVKSRGRGAL